MKSAKLPPARERDVQRQCLDYLAMLGYFAYRNNTGAFAGEYKGRKRFVRFGVKGAPDIIAVHLGRYIGIETKRARGAKLSEDQEAFRDSLVAAGGSYFVVRSLDDLIEALEGL
jgi:Holliday junction resolvase